MAGSLLRSSEEVNKINYIRGFGERQGIMIGLVVAFVLTHAMTSMLVGVKATDPLTFVAITSLFFIIAAIASWLPARRGANVDPTISSARGVKTLRKPGEED